MINKKRKTCAKTLEKGRRKGYINPGDVIMITINDIATALNLSTATVSNALSGKGRVSEANRQVIIDKAKEMGGNGIINLRIEKIDGGYCVTGMVIKRK